MADRKPEFDNQSKDPDERWEEAGVKGVQEGLRRLRERQRQEGQLDHAERLGEGSELQTPAFPFSVDRTPNLEGISLVE